MYIIIIMDKLNKTKYKQKNISITEEQEKFIQDNFINLSRFVQSKIEELRKK